jgi:molybdopterin biosynthesis enzyme
MNSINVDNALSTMLSAAQPLSAENDSLGHALGRVTAARVVADEDAVPFSRSAMDGYAVRASECALANSHRQRCALGQNTDSQVPRRKRATALLFRGCDDVLIQTLLCR